MKPGLDWKRPEFGYDEDREAMIGSVTYRAERVMGYGGYAATVRVHGPRGGRRRLALGHCKTIADAKCKCEQHYAAGCDLSRAERGW
jgi:hypothetical protein